MLVSLLLLAAVVACASWTVTNEEVFREPRDFCVSRSKLCQKIWQRKFFYLFTCEYCFSHYVAAAVVFLADLRVVRPDWIGAVFAWFVVIGIANVYMSLFRLVRVWIKLIGNKAKVAEHVAEKYKP